MSLGLLARKRIPLLHWVGFAWAYVTPQTKKKGACIIKDSPACPLKCTISSQLQSPTWWRLWCRWAPGQRSVPSSCWAVSAPPCGAWRRCGWRWRAWVWWSPWTRAAARSSVGWGRRGSARCRSCSPPTSWGWRSWCSPLFGRVHSRHRRNSRLEKEIS